MFLDSIAGHVRRELESRRRQVSLEQLRERPLFHRIPRGFEKSLQGAGRHIIAEIKRASPSQGLIREDFDAVKIAQAYVANGANALSILTEEKFFQGSLLYLEEVRKEISIPLLRKDFILDSYQLLEARSYGADAVLLIAALLEPSQLRGLQDEARSLSLDTLVEVHSESELEVALEAGSSLVGINNRDLHTFQVTLETTRRLKPLVPPGVTVVSESGIDSPEHIQGLEKLGVQIFLIGEALMRTPDPGAKLRELLEVED